MRNGKRVGVVIPALNEEQAIGYVIGDIPSWVDDIVVADNGSHDCTAAAARAAGARVVVEQERGYGAACQAGIAALRGPDIIVFLDGDYSDRPQEMAALVDPIALWARACAENGNGEHSHLNSVSAIGSPAVSFGACAEQPAATLAPSAQSGPTLLDPSTSKTGHSVGPLKCSLRQPKQALGIWKCP